MNCFDVLIIGGGASGLSSAVRIKELCPKISVCIIEQLPRVGKKLITTGNGRCNITNKNFSLKDYHGEDVSFAKYSLDNYGLDYTADFFEKIGIVFTYGENGKAYPHSLQASSVVDALRFTAEEIGVETFVGVKVLDIKQNNGYTVSTSEGDFFAKKIVVASGLLSGGRSVGSDGSVIKILKSLGYKTVKMTPSIVQIKTDTTLTKQLKGIKVNADVSLYMGRDLLRREYGEVLFCDYGLSGPPVLQLSRFADRESGLKICLDIMPEISFYELADMLEKRRKNLSYRNNDEFFTGLINKRLGQIILKNCGLGLNDKVREISTFKLKEITTMIKSLEFEVKSTNGFDNSQVTAGGIATLQFDDKTMMSKKDKNLYCIGEILDIDGDCGGFNLQWAWSSAFCAAEHIARDFK